MKRVITNIFVIILFLAGLSLLLYPFVANEWNTYRQNQLLTNYDQTIAEQEAQGSIDYRSEWDRANAYNDGILPMILPDSFAIAQATDAPDPEYLACINLAGDGMMGYVEIPKIKIKLPIYHTTYPEVLEKAAGHLEGSSLPVGGPSTHAVISAHRGLPSAALFTDLDKLKEGDHFILRILDEILCYEVDMISVVKPTETEALQVEDGEDHVTLLTCTPYGVNSHRLLVRGHRVPYVEEVIQQIEEQEATVKDISIHTNYLMWVYIGLGITGAFVIFLFVREKKLRRRLMQERIQKLDNQDVMMDDDSMKE